MTHVYDSHDYDSHDYDSHDYDSQDMVSPNCGHHDCIIFYPLNNLNCEHRTRTLPHYNKCHASLLIVPCYEKIYVIIKKKLNSTTRCCTIEKHSTQSYAEIYLEALPFCVTPKSTAISYLSFTAWWLNKQDNDNNNNMQLEYFRVRYNVYDFWSQPVSNE